MSQGDSHKQPAQRPRRRRRLRGVRIPRIPFLQRYAVPGTAPGTLEAPAPRVEAVRLQCIRFGPDVLEETDLTHLDELADIFRSDAIAAWPVTWLHVTGLHDLDVITRLGDLLGLHPLALEDVVRGGQRPKLEEFDDHLFLVLRQVHPPQELLDGAADDSRAVDEALPGGAPAGAGKPPGLWSEQLSLFYGPGWVLTFEEAPPDGFEPVRERLRRTKGRIRNRGSDYLAYALVDALVDRCFPVLEAYGYEIEALEDEVTSRPTEDTLTHIHHLRRQLLALRRAAWPLRDVTAAMERLEPPHLARETRVFVRDLYDHAIQILDLLETYRDLVTGLLDIYLSSVSNRMNEVMKVLTIMASIFIPLTFIAGIYGMNFDPEAGPWAMPELSWPWAYPVVLGFMLAIALGMLWLFRRMGWLGSR